MSILYVQLNEFASGFHQLVFENYDYNSYGQARSYILRVVTSEDNHILGIE